MNKKQGSGMHHTGGLTSHQNNETHGLEMHKLMKGKLNTHELQPTPRKGHIEE